MLSIASAETIYRFGVPHKCEDYGACTYGRYLTDKVNLTNELLNFCTYLSLDFKNASGLSEFPNKDGLGPITAFVINLDKPMYYQDNKVNSIVQFVEFSCKEKKMRLYGFTYYAKYFGAGKTIKIFIGNYKWAAPVDAIYEGAMKLLCENNSR